MLCSDIKLAIVFFRENDPTESRKLSVLHWYYTSMNKHLCKYAKCDLDSGTELYFERTIPGQRIFKQITKEQIP